MFLDLEQHLKEEKNARLKLIVTDGVFSMDGDIAPLDMICKLADKHGALVFVDEAHATGFFGKTGRYENILHYMVIKSLPKTLSSPHPHNLQL